MRINRAIYHDLLVARRETAAALAGWSDRLLVLAGLALIVAGTRQATADAPIRAIEGIALLIGGAIGLECGRLAARRLSFHRDAYLFAADVLSRAGGWRYRLGVGSVVALVVASTAVVIDRRAAFPALAGATAGLALAFANQRAGARLTGSVRPSTDLLRHGVGATGALAIATLPLWWPTAPAWVPALPIAAIVAMMSPADAEVVRFEARIGRRPLTALVRLRRAALWLIGLTLIEAIVEGPAAAGIAALIGLILLWWAALRLLAWRMAGRRSGELIVMALAAASGVAGALAIVLAPAALAAGSIWLWRRSRTATWLIA
ncbi:hypothetical protein [Hephaestia mangrovi]|uniref:hypothetical protein n=1 Tax=Hephaestia mangrovi TaxID=2873268 RepID=UPI001CA67227|nr:hypothetical protein [Hephaestia mangrovi]MBY8826743.1 hypothetical protein [Hephaestia mangrovi]